MPQPKETLPENHPILRTKGPLSVLFQATDERNGCFRIFKRGPRRWFWRMGPETLRATATCLPSHRPLTKRGIVIGPFRSKRAAFRDAKEYL